MQPKQNFDFTDAILDPRITFTRALNTATRVNSSGEIEIVQANTARFNYSPVTLSCQGLLIEESRTNKIKNNTMQGAVSGSPGSLPTNWKQSLQAGVSREIIGIGVEDGIDYIDFRFFGTPSSTGGCFMYFNADTEIPALPSNNFAFSSYFRLVNGSWSNIGTGSLTGLGMNPRNSAADSISGGVLTPYQANSNKLITQRVAIQNYTTPVNTAYVQSYFRFGVTSGNAIDFTIRIGLPQTENGLFVTSVIKTSSAQVTRNADEAVITGSNFSDWWQAGFGGATVQTLPSTVSGICPLIQFDDGTANEIIALRGNTTKPELYIVDGGTPQAQIDAGTIAANTDYSMTAWWQTNDCKARLNNGAVVTDTSATIPTVTQALLGSDGTNYLNGHLASISYYDSFSEQIYTRRKNKAVFNLM